MTGFLSHSDINSILWFDNAKFEHGSADLYLAENIKVTKTSPKSAAGTGDQIIRFVENF